MTSDINFQSAKELVDEFKRLGNNAYDIFTKHPDYEEELIRRAKEADLDYYEVMNLAQAEKVIISQLWDDILSVFSDEEAEQLRRKVAIGLVNSGEIRARTERYKFDAILINYGMVTFINQCTKYKIASDEPQYITFCDRKDPSTVTLEDINAFYGEMIAMYRIYKIPYAPLILLDPRADHLRGDMVYIKELFIISHELAHVLLNHREPSHEAEFEADHLAFNITKNVLSKKRKLLNEKFILVSLVDLFRDMQYLIGAKESKDHPPAILRLITLVNSNYGQELAMALKKALIHGEFEEYERILRKVPNYSESPE